MTHRRFKSFRLRLVAGWLIASTFFSVLARLVASFDDMTPAERGVTGISIHALALLAGFAFARFRTPRAQLLGDEVVRTLQGGTATSATARVRRAPLP